jgi:DNA-binding response OmpR family regulator
MPSAPKDPASSVATVVTLVVDPDDALRPVLRSLGRDRAIDVVTPADGADLVDAFERHLPDVVIARLEEPGGVGVTHALRRLRTAVPCRLVIIAHDATAAQRAAHWADAPLVGPVDGLGLGAAIDAAIEVPRPSATAAGHRAPSAARHGVPDDDLARAEPIRSGPFVVDGSTRSATCDGMPLALTRTEFELLLLFVEHPEQVLTRGQIVEHVWGDWFGNDHVIDVHLSRLRRKIAQRGGPAALSAVRGVGFRLLEPDGT